MSHELADVNREDRERILAGRQVTPELRTELESLLDHDSASDDRTGRVSGPLCTDEPAPVLLDRPRVG